MLAKSNSRGVLRFGMILISISLTALLGHIAWKEFGPIRGHGANWKQSDIDASMRHGDEIVAAIEAFRTDHNHYPDSLNDLTPKYLEMIQPPNAGSCRWEYNTFKGQTFSLVFRSLNVRVYYWRNSFSKSWALQSPEQF